jgi:putative mycofactocin binding protein MftB
MLDEAWRLDPAVALRPEPFGALAYHFGNRKLVFLKRPELVTVVIELAEHGTVRDALVAAGLPESAWPAYLAALTGLAESGMVRKAEVAAA